MKKPVAAVGESKIHPKRRKKSTPGRIRPAGRKLNNAINRLQAKLGIARSEQLDITTLRLAIDAIAAGNSLRTVCKALDVEDGTFRAAVRAAGLMDELHKANGERAVARLDQIEDTLTELPTDDPESFKLELQRQKIIADLTKWRAERENPRYHPKSIDLGIKVDATQAIHVLARILGLEREPVVIDADDAPRAVAPPTPSASDPEHPADDTDTDRPHRAATVASRNRDTDAS